MPTQSTLTLNSKVYAARGTTGGISTWKLVGDTSFGGATASATSSVSEPSKDGVTRVRFRLQVPLAASADSTCACIGQVLATGLMDCTVVLPSQLSSAERTDFRTRITDLFASAEFISAVEDLEGSWG